ncbi:hypothetical protein [Leptotrichia sp. oral taxon 847]|uniref:hypothetical protein n=1 Tax=Leptotrichia sp. oral taxon 847 TaxID=1785996 RepID=UPI00076837AF|nr:hypothetical protein [Leptotrichia sp. oral taxon 847]AMD94449.1 hypothetical protein AXF11_01790 [Leptotrichia sp. oral taxon 847]
MKNLNILGMATLIATNVANQELKGAQQEIDKKTEVKYINKNENNPTNNTKKTNTQKNMKKKNSHKKLKNKRKKKHRTRQEILSGIDFIDVAQFFQNDMENEKVDKRESLNNKVEKAALNEENGNKKNKVILTSNPDLIVIDKNFKNEKVKNMGENTDKQDKLQKKLDKKILKDKLKELKKKKAALKRRIKMMDRDLKKDNTFITEEIYVQNKKNKNKKVVSAKTEKNPQNEKILNADTLNVITFSNNLD